jgi:V8-like Glu-specific endopeptidase
MTTDHEIIGLDTRLRVGSEVTRVRGYEDLESSYPRNSRTVLTAGHALKGADRVTDIDAARLRIIPGRDGTLEPLPATMATEPFVFLPGYYAGVHTDLAIIHLADPIGDEVGYWSLDHKTRAGDRVGTSILSGANVPKSLCRGHSGSPVWVRRHPSRGGRVLVAVNTGSGANDSGKNSGVLIDPVVRQFIVGNTQ